jgi:hypothetical protein
MALNPQSNGHQSGHRIFTKEILTLPSALTASIRGLVSELVSVFVLSPLST